MDNEGKKRIEQELPVHMVESLERYVQHHIAPGSFLEAVICNDLRNALTKADPINRKLLVYYVWWLENAAPAESYGSLKAYHQWLEKRKLAK